MSAKMSQKEYLKKYLSGGSDKKKKKKDKRAKSRTTTVKIIDDDEHGGTSSYIDEELLLTGEDAPQIVGIIDASGASSENKWKSFGCSRPEESIQVDDDPWGKKETSPVRQRSVDRNRNASDQSINPRRVKDIGRTSSDIDQSPPRMRSNVRSNHSPMRRRFPGPIRRSSDQSPPRRRSPLHRRKNSDHSPPRKRSPRRNLGQSPHRRRSPRNSDQSPPRKRSPFHSKRNSDQSPPRRRSPGRTRWAPDESSPRRRSPARSTQNSDRPPPRRNSKNDIDLSPVRIKREKSSDQSPPRRRVNGNPFRVEKSSANNSPPRRRARLDSDQSPVRIKSERRSESPPPTHKPSTMSKTLDGKRAGLQDAKTLKLETEERRRNEDSLFNKMSTEISGRDAEVQVRQSSSYRRRRKDLEEDPEVQRKKAAHEQHKKELYDRWNKGLKQIEAYQAKVSDDNYESNKPLARYSNDADLDELLRHKEREDDPMLAYIRSKKKDQQTAANVPVMPKYKGSFPENRFGIPPGYRWDGVDRSSGYERKWFDVQNQKKALADEAYKYSTEDM